MFYRLSLSLLYRIFLSLGAIIERSKIIPTFLNILGWMALLFATWVVLSFIGLVITIGLMYVTRNHPSFDLEMGWMAILMLVPVATAILSLILSPALFRALKRIILNKRKSDEDTIA